MSNSYRHTSIKGITKTESEKRDKRIANRRFRRIARERLKKDFSVELKNIREIDELWTHSKDGKFRFDPNKFPNLMRK